MAGGPPKLSDDVIRERLAVYEEHGRNQARAASALGISRSTLQSTINDAAGRGMLGTEPVLPGFRLAKTTAVYDRDGKLVREFVQQKPEHGEKFEAPAGHLVKGISVLVDRDGNEVQKWIKTREDIESQHAAMEAVVAAFKEEIPRAVPSSILPSQVKDDLLNQYTVTDLHMGMLSWREETGADYDLKIAEQLLIDWFAAAIKSSPPAGTAVFAQLGDLLHYDSHESVTPASRHVVDSDSRFQKMVRAAIRASRRIISMLLEKHQNVHVIMADANHDTASEAWLREMFAAFYEDEPRVTVDRSAGTYYLIEHGNTSLFYHHGHKRRISDIDSVFAGKFREAYGRTKFSYAHIGHLHSDELKSTNLMKVERHETLAAPDAYASNGGWLSGRSAKVITYSKRFGEVGRITLTPEMVAA